MSLTALTSVLLSLFLSSGSIAKASTAPEARQDFAPKISPDGQWVAFYGYDHTGTPDLYVVSIDGRSERRLTDTPEFWEILPQWSPDGARLYYTAGESMTAMDIWSIDVASGEAQQVTGAGTNVRSVDATTSLMQNEFAFIRTLESGETHFVLRDMDTQDETILLRHNIENASFGRLNLRPDGRQLLFTASFGLNEAPLDNFLYILDIETGRARQITHERNTRRRQASWTREGDALLYAQDLAGSYDIYRLTLETGEVHRVSFLDNATELFSDQRGDVLVFDAGQYPGEHPACIYASRADGSDLRRLTGICEYHLAAEDTD